MKTYLVAILCLVLSVNALAQSDWKRLVNADDNYSIKYPADWELNESGQMGTSFIILSQQESEEDQFRENVNLAVQDLSAHPMDLDQYTALSEQQITQMFTDAELISSERMEGDNEYHQVVFTGKQGIFNLKFVQQYWVIDDTAYVLTFTTEVDQYEAFREMGEKIMASFRLM